MDWMVQVAGICGGSVSVCIPRKLRDPPGISGLDFEEKLKDSRQARGHRIPGGGVGAQGAHMGLRGKMYSPRDQLATERPWSEVGHLGHPCQVLDSRVGLSACLPFWDQPTLAS